MRSVSMMVTCLPVALCSASSAAETTSVMPLLHSLEIRLISFRETYSGTEKTVASYLHPVNSALSLGLSATIGYRLADPNERLVKSTDALSYGFGLPAVAVTRFAQLELHLIFILWALPHSQESRMGHGHKREEFYDNSFALAWQLGANFRPARRFSVGIHYRAAPMRKSASNRRVTGWDLSAAYNLN